MIVFTTEERDGATVVRLFGDLGAEDAPAELADRLDQVGLGGPLLVDLTEATPVPGPAVAELLARLEAGRRRSATVLVHGDLEARRSLRAISRQLPVVPDVAQAVAGHFSATLAPRRPGTPVG